VKLPGAHRAIVPPEKVRDYLLSTTSPRARGKAAFFRALGFQACNWEALQSALLDIARSGDARAGRASEFGTKYEVRATMTGPAGRLAVVKTVWIIEAGDDQPRFVTAYPD
jgi:hypothetical protein